jgi:hypothetical protein
MSIPSKPGGYQPSFALSVWFGLGFGGDAHVSCGDDFPLPSIAAKGPMPFIGCRHFSKINRRLAELGHREIDWQV